MDEVSEWIVGHDAEGREFMIHAWHPRFVGTLLDDDQDGERLTDVVFWDPVDEYSEMELARLMRRCGEALAEIDAADLDHMRALEEEGDV
jgi:hypothetical protein